MNAFQYWKWIHRKCNVYALCIAAHLNTAADILAVLSIQYKSFIKVKTHLQASHPVVTEMQSSAAQVGTWYWLKAMYSALFSRAGSGDGNVFLLVHHLVLTEITSHFVRMFMVLMISPNDCHEIHNRHPRSLENTIFKPTSLMLCFSF